MNDIDLSGIDWSPIGYYATDDEANIAYYSFTGTLDGNGYSIKILSKIIQINTQAYLDNL